MLESDQKNLHEDQLREKDARIQELEKQIRLKEIERSLYYDKMQMELKNGFDKDKIIADLQAKLNMLAPEQKPSFKPPFSLPPASTQPSADQRTSSDKSLTQIKQFYQDRSPEISESMIVSDDSESDDENESDLEFAPNASKRSLLIEKNKRERQAKAKERAKMMMDSALAMTEPWKCRICSSFFRTSAELRQHILANHKDQKHFCSRCPYTYNRPDNLKTHQQAHFTNDTLKNKADGRECKLCKICFADNGHFSTHLHNFHLDN